VTKQIDGFKDSLTSQKLLDNMYEYEIDDTSSNSPSTIFGSDKEPVNFDKMIKESETNTPPIVEHNPQYLKASKLVRSKSLECPLGHNLRYFLNVYEDLE
jgi:hypothetical protein